MKYCITYTLRHSVLSYVNSVYREFFSIKQLNDFIFCELCNSHTSYELIGLYFEVVNNEN